MHPVGHPFGNLIVTAHLASKGKHHKYTLQCCVCTKSFDKWTAQLFKSTNCPACGPQPDKVYLFCNPVTGDMHHIKATNVDKAYTLIPEGQYFIARIQGFGQAERLFNVERSLNGLSWAKQPHWLAAEQATQQPP